MSTPSKSSPRPEFAAILARLGLTESQGAAYLGVPVFTFRKWLTGERAPSAAVLRLLDVLGMVEAMAPALHASLVPAAPVAGGRRARQARPRSAQEEPAPRWVTAPL